jgi:hypothetical protein
VRRTLLLALTAVLAGWSAPPLQVKVAHAALVAGPGREPEPGSRPFETRLQAEVSLSGLEPSAAPTFRMWRAPNSLAKGLREGRPVHPRAKGFTRIKATVRPLPLRGVFQVLAPSRAPWKEEECLVVEVFLQGRWAGRGTATLVEMNRPVARPGETEPRP